MKEIRLKGLLLIGLTAFFISAIAQHKQPEVPGYAGKRFLTTVNAHSFPALARANRLADIRMNFRPSIQTEYVLTRAHSIYAQFSLLQTTTDYERDSMTGMAQINAKGIELGVRLYSLQRRGSLAPMGFHHQLGLLFLPYSVQDLDGNFAQGKEDLGSYRDVALTYAIGDQRIIHPSIVYFFNLQAGWLLNFSPTQSTLEGTLVKEFATSRLRNFSLLNISFGLGFILF